MTPHDGRPSSPPTWRPLPALALVIVLSAAGCGRGIDEAAAGVTTAAATTTTTTTVVPSDTTEPPQATGEIVVWVPGRQRVAVQEAAAGFTTATGIDVVVEAVEIDDMENAINGAVGPDLFLGKHTWLARLAPRGLAADPEMGPRSAEFVPIAADAFTYDGVLFGAPVTLESIALIYNNAIVTTAPGAMSEVKETCVQLRGEDVTTTTGADTTTTTEDTTTTTEVAAPLGPACLQFVADDARVSLAFVTSGDGYLYRRVEGAYLADDVGLGGPSATARAETVRALVADGVVGGAADQASMVEDFASGETPFVIGDIALAEALSASGTPFGVAPLPIITGTTPEPYADVTGWMLSGRSTEAETALLFLNDYLVNPVAMADLFSASSGLPAYQATADLTGADPVLAGMLAAAANGVPTPIVDGIDEVLEALGPMLAEIVNVEGAEPEALLDEVTETALRLVA